MSDWMQQYSAALDIRDAREQAHKQYIDAYTQLADRTATTVAPGSTTPNPAAPTGDPALANRTPTPTKGNTPKPNPSDQPTALHSLRTDLSATQKARTTLQSRVSELSGTLSDVQNTLQTSAAQVALLTRQKAESERKLRDREEEIREKGKLAEQAQDEMVSLQLQLHMAERRQEELGRENRELVERWMKRMGEEVERVNRDSRWE